MAEPIKEAAYEDLYSLPESVTGQILDGELVVTPRPTRGHAHAVTILGADLVPPYQLRRGGGPGGWSLYQEPEIHFDRSNIIVPDLAGWKAERLTMLPEEHRFTVTPDWVCEVLSPGTARNDRIKKMRIFAIHGVPYVWLVDPILMTLEVFKLESGRWVLLDGFGGEDKLRAEPFQEIEIDLAELWIRSSEESSMPSEG